MASFQLPPASKLTSPITTIAEARVRIEELETQLLHLRHQAIPVPFHDDLTRLEVLPADSHPLEVLAVRSHSLSGRMRFCLAEELGCPRSECHTLLLLTW